MSTRSRPDCNPVRHVCAAPDLGVSRRRSRRTERPVRGRRTPPRRHPAVGHGATENVARACQLAARAPLSSSGLHRDQVRLSAAPPAAVVVRNPPPYWCGAVVPSARAAGCGRAIAMSESRSRSCTADVRSLRVSDGVVFKKLDDESVLLDLRSGTYFGLNDTGTCLWQGLSELQNVDAAVRRLLETFEVDLATARADAIRLVALLVERRLLVSADGPEPT